jgi:hypothetical protein
LKEWSWACASAAIPPPPHAWKPLAVTVFKHTFTILPLTDWALERTFPFVDVLECRHLASFRADLTSIDFELILTITGDIQHADVVFRKCKTLAEPLIFQYFHLFER